MSDAANPESGARAAGAAAAGSANAPAMDLEFIQKNQIIERYLTNRLPAKGALDFERFCRENPKILNELQVSERVNAGVRLMEVAGLALPWEVRPKRFWERLPVVLGLALLALGAWAKVVSYRDLNDAGLKTISELRDRIAAQPLDPVQTTRSMKVELSREKPAATPVATVISARAELAELKLQVGWSTASQFRVTIDRIGHGRALVLSNLQRDSNGEVRVAINTSLLGPGDYQFQVDGLGQRGEFSPQGWATIRFAR